MKGPDPGVELPVFNNPNTNIPFSFFFYLFAFSRAAPMAHGGSQARGRIRATATLDPSHVCNLHHSSRQRWILNPLSEARDRTCILMDAVGFITH